MAARKKSSPPEDKTDAPTEDKVEASAPGDDTVYSEDAPEDQRLTQEQITGEPAPEPAADPGRRSLASTSSRRSLASPPEQLRSTGEGDSPDNPATDGSTFHRIVVQTASEVAEESDPLVTVESDVIKTEYPPGESRPRKTLLAHAGQVMPQSQYNALVGDTVAGQVEAPGGGDPLSDLPDEEDPPAEDPAPAEGDTE